MSVWLNYARPDGGAHPLHARQFDAVITPMRAPASGPALQTENENRMNVSMSTKKRVASSVLAAVMGISLLYGTGCSAGQPSSQKGTETVMEFPAAEAFTIAFDLQKAGRSRRGMQKPGRIPASRSRWQAWRRFMTCTTRRSRPSSSGPSPRRWNFRNKQAPAPSPGRGGPYGL